MCDNATSLSGAKYCDEHVCLSVCPLAYLENYKANVCQVCVLCMLPCAVARSSSVSDTICYLLPVLVMTSCFHMVGPMARHVYSVAKIAELLRSPQRRRVTVQIRK